MHILPRAMAAGLILVTTLACGLFAPATVPDVAVSTMVAETLNAVTEAAAPPADTPAAPAGQAAAFPGGNLVIPTGLASGISSEMVAAVAADESMPWWGTWPEHVKVKLEGYALQGTFHKPEILIFPAGQYAAQNQSVADNLQQLRNQLANPGSLTGTDVPPTVPFFNAGSLMSAKPEVIQFPGGRGIRALTEYAQFYAPINNNGLFYHFQGLTDDNEWFIIAILPVSAPVLADGSDPSDMAPTSGVPFPGYDIVEEGVFETYYESITSLLNSTPADDFEPRLTALDALIQSIEIAP